MTQQLPPRLQPDVVQEMKALIFEIARALVDDPDTISVEAIDDQGSTVLRSASPKKTSEKLSENRVVPHVPSAPSSAQPA